MIEPLSLQSERYHPTGNVSAEGVKNQLGRPGMDRLTLLVRETVQNSWDARLDDGPVRYRLDGWTLSEEQQAVLADRVLPEAPPGLDLQLGGGRRIRMLAISDRGASGLGGPTRADAVVPAGEPRDFVDFLRNVGQPPDKRFGGGTYGFGKASLYLASCARTILVYTRFRSGGQVQSRFIGAALGSQFDVESGPHQGRYTGRHWWGRLAADGIAEPVEGSGADEAAGALGIPCFGPEETGTTLVVVDPDFGEAEPEQAMNAMAEAVLRYFWPKLVDGPEGAASMQFDLSWEGNALPLPAAASFPPLDGYSRAFANLRASIEGRGLPHPEGTVKEIWCLRPSKLLGRVSLLRMPARPRRRLDTGGEGDPDPPFSSPAHHVALMRSPHLVVKYLPGPPPPDDRLEYAGVFAACDDVDGAFAASEPPTHDDWVPDVLEERHEKTFVRTAFRRLGEALQEFTSPPRAGGGAAREVPLGAFADRLGGLIPGEDGPGAGIPADDGDGAPGTGSGPGSVPGAPRRAARVVVREPARQELTDGIPSLVVDFSVEHRGEPVDVVVRAVPRVLVLDGGFESDPPEGAEQPVVLRWVDPSSAVLEAADRVLVPAGASGAWSVAVSIPEDAAISVELTALEEG